MQNQITTNPQSSSTSVLSIPASSEAESTISVFCDICDEQAAGTRRELCRRGWGISSAHAFCPFHEDSI